MYTIPTQRIVDRVGQQGGVVGRIAIEPVEDGLRAGIGIEHGRVALGGHRQALHPAGGGLVEGGRRVGRVAVTALGVRAGRASQGARAGGIVEALAGGEATDRNSTEGRWGSASGPRARVASVAATEGTRMEHGSESVIRVSSVFRPWLKNAPPKNKDTQCTACNSPHDR